MIKGEITLPRIGPASLVAVLISLLAACSSKEDVGATTPAPPPGPPTLERTPSATDARVYFVTPADGATVSSPLTVEFGMDVMAVVPAGDTTDNSGHHHVLIDTGLPDLNLPIPKDEKHVHFGDGSSQAQLDLAPGNHTLQLLFADYLHIPHDPPVYSERITVTVE